MKAKYILWALGAGLFAMAPQSLQAQANLTWDTANTNNTWSTANANWIGGATFANGDNVTFDAAVGEAVTVVAGGVVPATMTVGANNGAWTFSGGTIAGALIKNGTGALTLSSANAFTSIALNGGNLNLGNANALGSGTLTASTSTSTNTTTSSMLVTTTLTGNVTIPTSITLPNDTVANINRALYMNGATATNTVQLSGKISGGSANTRLYLNNSTGGAFAPQFIFANNNNDFRATVWINRGGIQIASNEALGDLANTVTFDSNSGADLTFLSSMSYTRATTLQTGTDFDTRTNTVTVSGVISGGAYINKIGTGTLVLSAANTNTGATSVTVGTLKLNHVSALGATAAGTTVATGGALDLNGLTMGAEALTLNGTGISAGGALINSSATAASWAGNVTLGANASIGGTGDITISGTLNGAFVLSKTGTGNLTLSGASTAAGSTVKSEVGTVFFSGSMVPVGSIIAAPGAMVNVSGLSTPLTLASGASLIAGRASAAATDVTGNVFSGTGNLRVMEGAGIGKMTIAGNLTLNGGTAHFDLSNNPAGANDTIEVSGVLDLNAATDVSLSLPNGSLGNGSYVLAKGVSLSGSAALINVLGLPAVGTSRQTFSVSSTTVANALTLDVTGNAASLLWTGATNGNWSTNSTDENWNNTTAPDPQDRFFNTDGVTFADRVSPGPQTITISGDVTPSALTVNNTAAGTSYTLEGGAIKGVTGLLKQGNGLLTITGDTHTFTGAVEIQGGELQALFIANSGLLSSLGAGNSIVLNGGKLTVTEGSTQSNDRALTIGTSGGTLAGADLSTSVTFAGPLSGDGNLTISGAGRIVLSGAGSRAGVTTIETGATLEIAGNATPGAGAFTVDGTLVVNKSVASTIPSAISGTGKLEKQGAGSLTLPVANSYAGGTTLAGGALLMLHPSAAGSGAISQTGGAVRFSFGDGTLTTVANDFTLHTTGNATFSVRGTNDAPPTQATTVRLTGKISGGAAGQTFNLVDSLTSGNHFNVIELRNANNDFQGTILMNRGTLGIDSDAALGHPDNDIQHFTENLSGSLRFDADNIVLGAGREIIMPPAANVRPINTQAFTGTIQGNISGSGILVKQGTGKLILTGTNSNVSVTTVAAGTLQVDGVFATSTAVVTVDAAAILGGVGTINRPITVNGTIAPGASVGTLTTAATTINGTYACEVSAATSDVIAATDLILGAASTLVVTDSAGVFPRTIATYSGSLTGNFASVTSGFSVDYSTPGQVILRKGGYAAWASQFASSGAANADSDNDGVPNGVEYFMGVNAAGFTSNPAVVNNEITWPKDSTVTDASYVVEYSTDLDQWTTATTGVADTGTQVKYTLPTGQAKYFVRLRVTITP